MLYHGESANIFVEHKKQVEAKNHRAPSSPCLAKTLYPRKKEQTAVALRLVPIGSCVSKYWVLGMQHSGDFRILEFKITFY